MPIPFSKKTRDTAVKQARQSKRKSSKKPMEKFRASLSLSKKSAVLKNHKFDKNLGETESISEIHKRVSQEAAQNPMIQNIMDMIKKMKI